MKGVKFVRSRKHRSVWRNWYLELLGWGVIILAASWVLTEAGL